MIAPSDGLGVGFTLIIAGPPGVVSIRSAVSTGVSPDGAWLLTLEAPEPSTGVTSTD